ncbi:MAG: sulfurtransferase [Candidatus Nitrosocaldaceae archaeon]
MIVTPKKLHDRLNDTLIIDTREWHEYVHEHIPNAINLDLFAFHFYDTSKDGIEIFNKVMTKLLSSVGVSYDKFIVLYDNISGITASRGLWILHYFSHENCAILDGGIEEWKKLYETESKLNIPKPSEFKPRINKSVLATLDDVLSKDYILIDARSKEEYDGKIVRAARGGHIPNAINIEWKENINGNIFKDKSELKKIYNIDKKIICYCQGGYRAAHTYIALKMLSKDAKVYLGSWYEYGNRLDLPIEI